MDWKKYFKKEKKSQEKRSKSNRAFPRRGIDYKPKQRREEDGLLEKSTS
jgi:hypothetical protein